MVKMKEQTNHLFFVQLKDPNQIRRNILETLKGILEILQRFEKFKQIRHQKLENINKLRASLKETNKMFGTLKLKLPQINLRIPVEKKLPVQAKEEQIKQNQPEKKKVVLPLKKPKREMTEVDKLESELSAIESRLKDLT